MRKRRVAALAVATLALALSAGTARAQEWWVQQGPKLAPLPLEADSYLGQSIAISADGGTALVGTGIPHDPGGNAWPLVRGDDGRWLAQGPPLTPLDAIGWGWFATSVALSADGDTALVGAPGDDDGLGAAWTFTRANGVWSQAGGKLVPADPARRPPFEDSDFGASVALSADGEVALVGGPTDDGSTGAAWIFVRTGGSWVQQGPKLTPDAAQQGFVQFGVSTALSTDGGTALVGAPGADGGQGAVWIFERSGGRWGPAGTLLAPADRAVDGRFGSTVALDAAGALAVVGGRGEDGRSGVWIFERDGAQWTQAGARLTASHETWSLGGAMALAPGGDQLLVGGADDGAAGAAWLYRREGAAWTEHAHLSPSDPQAGTKPNTAVGFGGSVALASDASTLLVGGLWDNDVGALWTFVPAAEPLVVARLRAFLGRTLPPGPLVGRVQLEDGDVPTGTIAFRLYGPDPVACSGPPAQTEVVRVRGNGTYEARGLSAGALGEYQVVAAYSGDARHAPLITRCRQQAFRVLVGAQLGLDVRGAREVGAPLTIAPSIVGGRTPSGAVTVSVYGPTDPLCARAPLMTRRVAAEAGRIPATPYVPLTTGRHTVTVAYGGDDDDPALELSCEQGAKVSIDRTAALIAASASPPVAVGGAIGAGARVAGFQAGGTVTFLLFSPSDPTCSGRPLATVDSRLTDGVAQSQAFATSASGVYHLTATYAGDRNNHPVASTCEAGAVAVARRRPTLSATARASASGALRDTVVLSGAFRARGNVRFMLYGRKDPRCRRRSVFTMVTPLGDDGRATTTPLTGAAPGHYQFVVRYAGDVENEAAETACGENPVRVRAARARRSRDGHVRRRHAVADRRGPSDGALRRLLCGPLGWLSAAG